MFQNLKKIFEKVKQENNSEVEIIEEEIHAVLSLLIEACKVDGIVSDNEIELNGLLVDINANVEISGTTTQTGISTSTAKDVFNAGLSVKNGSTSAGFVEFFEDSDNGTNKVTVIGPSSTSDVTLTLPSSAGTIATTATAADEATALAIALG